MGRRRGRKDPSGSEEPRFYLGPQAPRRPRRRRFHIAAILAAAVYFAGAYVAYDLYRWAWHGEGRVAAGFAEVTAFAGLAGADAAAAAEGEADSLTAEEREALRALATRAKESVFVVETAGTGQGSGFVAWVMQGESYVMTARRTVADVLDDGGRTVFVRRGSQIWTGRLIRAHRANGLALIRVNTELARPLWQARADADRLEPGGVAVVVPAGDTPFGEGTAGEQDRGRIPVEAHGHRLNLGAPVLGADGRIAGVVTQTVAGGISSVVPIEGACEAEIRRCG